ncbi:hypothetical protein FB451DRAFT_1193093 [Mycena latifolia]|nr:hypothetical protein FB451DRAFT_1193093 [Mycena latifolia]
MPHEENETQEEFIARLLAMPAEKAEEDLPAADFDVRSATVSKRKEEKAQREVAEKLRKEKEEAERKAKEKADRKAAEDMARKKAERSGRGKKRSRVEKCWVPAAERREKAIHRIPTDFHQTVFSASVAWRRGSIAPRALAHPAGVPTSPAPVPAVENQAGVSLEDIRLELQDMSSYAKLGLQLMHKEAAEGIAEIAESRKEKDRKRKERRRLAQARKTARNPEDKEEGLSNGKKA